MRDRNGLFRLEPGERVWQPVLSGSMGMEFLPGDEVCIEGISQEEWRRRVLPGTVAVFFNDGNFFFHRILLRRRTSVFEKGDGNAAGSWIGAKRIIGLVVGHRRGKGETTVDIPLVRIGTVHASLLFFKQWFRGLLVVRLVMKMLGRMKRWTAIIFK